MVAPALVPVVVGATGVIRMVGAPIASQLVKKGLVSKATAKQVKNFGKNIPKMSRQMQGKLTKEGARNVARRTPMRGPGGRKLTQLQKQKLMRENIQKGENAPTSSTAKSKIDKVSNAASGTEKGARVKKSVDKAMKKKSDEKALQAKEKATQRSIAERIAQRKQAASAGKRNIPSKTKPVPARGTSGRPTKTPANASGRNLSTSTNKSVAPRPRPKPNMKTVGSGKATPPNASGLRSLAAKQTVKPQIAVAGLDTKKPSKKKNDPVGSGQTPATGYVESKRKPKRNPVGSGQTPASGYVESKPSKTSSKFDDEGGKYKQYEWAKKLDPSDPRFQSGYMTQKGYDSEDMEAAKKGGQIKKLTKTKKVVKKKAAPKKSTAKKRKNFSGRGAGAALRGF
jgi:hypothetical protein